MSTQNSKEAQQRWLQQRLKRRAPGLSGDHIPTQPRNTPLPLSFAQQRLWFLHQLEPESTAYLMSSAFRISGPLVFPALEASLRLLVQRHEALRTTFAVEQDLPMQVIATEVPVTLPVCDLQSMSPAEQPHEVARLIDEETHQLFDLTVGPLFRFQVIKLELEEHVFLLTVHHMISDGWSMQVFFRELTTAYTAFCAGQPPDLPELPIQYADYAVWQRTYLQGDHLDRQLAYWREQLQEPLPTLGLPTDYPRPAIQTFRGAKASFTLSANITDGLKAVSRQVGGTLFMTVLTAFQLLLQRLAGQDDVCVGIPSAGRTRREIEQVMGFFINTLVIRTNLAGNPTFLELLEQVRDKCLNSYMHQDVPFEKLVETLHPTRDLSRTPFFQIFFNMMPGEATPLTLPGLTVTSVPKATADSKFDLTVYLREDAQQVSGTIVYNATLFRAERIEAFVAQYQQLLHHIVAGPDHPIQRYSLVTEGSQAVLTDPHIPLDAPAQELVPNSIRAWAMRTPDQVAVRHEATTLCYSDILHRSEACARALRQQGVRQSDVVAIRGPRSAGLITTLIGVWLAGGVILPLDPKLPGPRQALMRRTSGAKFFVEVGGIKKEQTAEPHDLPVSCLVVDPSSGTIESCAKVQEEDLTLPPMGTDGPAYVFFTSGTTGEPKGILGSHQALAHFLSWQRETFGIAPQDRVAQFTSLSFDVVLRELFLPLTSGATVCLSSEEAGGQEHLAWMASEQITVMHQVPSVASFWLTSCAEPRALPSLRWVFFAGEPLSAQLLARWETACPGPAKFVNFYGPTETTLAKCWYIIPPDRVEGVQPLGRPLPQTQLWVVGEDHRLCGIGEVGELVIRTPFRSLGYLQTGNNSPPTFVRNPYRDDPTDLLYHTGDLGRYRPDGMLEILGRRDDQIKIRGVRIEPQEVTVVLGTCPNVQACTVMASHDTKGEMELTAYVVAQPDTLLNGSALRTYLSARMPSALVPSQYVLLEQLPLTPNGKIDRRALRSLTPAEVLEEVYVAPRTEEEVRLTKIWENVLGRERIGVHANFFELGGHSLLATQIMSRVQEAFEVTLPLRTLFESPTVAAFSTILKEFQEVSSIVSHPPIQPLSFGEKFPLSFSQERMWFLNQFAPTSAAYNIPWAFPFYGPIILDALEEAVNELRRRHAVLRTVFPAEDGQPVPQIHHYVPISIPVIDFQDCPDDRREAEVNHFAMTEAKRPFDMAQGPLMRVTFARVEPEQVVVLITLHHIVADGWSASIVRRELETLYDSFAQSQASSLDELPIQYQDFAAWQREWLQGKVLETQLRYWTDRLAGAPMVLDLPTDRPRGALQTFVGGRHVVELSRSLTVELNHLSHQEGVTLFMILLTSLSIQLGRYTASEDLLVGVPIANRHFLAIEDLIGTFVNTLVLRTKLRGNPSFLTLLRQVRQTTLEAYAHQDLPFEVLVDSLHPPRDLSRSPVFQVMLSVLNFAPAHTTRKEQKSRPVVERKTAQFDLTLAVTERSEQQHRMTWSYNSDLFDLATVQRMSTHFVHLLEEVVAQPQRRIHDLSILPDRERRQVVVEWNATAQPRPHSNVALPNLLETQATLRPDAVALIFEEQAITYGELNQKANQLAHYLQALGVGLDVRVAIYCERSLELVVGLWGIVKAGGAYVPIDPTYPPERVALMLEDAEANVIVTQQRSQTSLPRHEATVVCIDAEWPVIGQGPTSNPRRKVVPDNLAYMIYTSGSTGKPKGVQVHHRALMNFLEAMAREPGLDASDRLLAVTSLSFDIAGLELWLPVLVGGQVVLASRELAADGEQLMAYLATEAITVMQATPATWQLLLDMGWAGRPSLTLLCGGEALSNSLAQALVARSQRLWNLYGPTETTVWSTRWALSPDEIRIAIGRPIANTQVYLEDRRGQPVPIGVPGELAIGGEGVARGYWRRPDVTAERFVPHPYSTKPGARLYKTGDLVRARADGRLEWLARLDYQIKLRGYRIELGEIEAVIRQQPGVQNAVVLIREDRIDDRRLVAYVSMIAGHPFDQMALREVLQRCLPAYMVPSVFVGLETFPLTPNGKIDRKALPIPDDQRPDLVQGYVAPATPAEEVMAEIWAEVLGLTQIGRHDNFFELGGHSLLATQVMARIRTRLHHDLPLRTLFEQPTVAGLAEALQQAQTVQDAETSTDDLAHLLDSIDALSEEEAQALLEQEQQKTTDTDAEEH